MQIWPGMMHWHIIQHWMASMESRECSFPQFFRYHQEFFTKIQSSTTLIWFHSGLYRAQLAQNASCRLSHSHVAFCPAPCLLRSALVADSCRLTSLGCQLNPCSTVLTVNGLAFLLYVPPTLPVQPFFLTLV